MITAYDRNDLRSPRIRRYLPRFAAARRPRPEAATGAAGSRCSPPRDVDPDAGPGGAMTVVTPTGFGTVSCVAAGAAGRCASDAAGLAVRRRPPRRDAVPALTPDLRRRVRNARGVVRLC